MNAAGSQRSLTPENSCCCWVKRISNSDDVFTAPRTSRWYHADSALRYSNVANRAMETRRDDRALMKHSKGLDGDTTSGGEWRVGDEERPREPE